MGRRGQKKNKKPTSTEKDDTEKVTNEELMELMFQPMPPNKRAELNGIVEKLLNLHGSALSFSVFSQSLKASFYICKK